MKPAYTVKQAIDRANQQKQARQDRLATMLEQHKARATQARKDAYRNALLAEEHRQHSERQQAARRAAKHRDALAQAADTNLGDWRQLADQNIHKTPTGQWTTKDNK